MSLFKNFKEVIVLPGVLVVVRARDVLGGEAHDVQAQRVDALRQLVLRHAQRHALACNRIACVSHQDKVTYILIA